jgi:hypothetical protein
MTQMGHALAHKVVSPIVVSAATVRFAELGRSARRGDIEFSAVDRLRPAVVGTSIDVLIHLG